VLSQAEQILQQRKKIAEINELNKLQIIKFTLSTAFSVISLLISYRHAAVSWVRVTSRKTASTNGSPNLHHDTVTATLQIQQVRCCSSCWQLLLPRVTAGDSLCFTMGWKTPPNLLLPLWGLGPQLINTWFLRPTWVHVANDISICLAVLAQLTVVANRLTDWIQTFRLRYICSNNLHVMWSDNTQNDSSGSCLATLK